jgi:hypothetical protein
MRRTEVTPAGKASAAKDGKISSPIHLAQGKDSA